MDNATGSRFFVNAQGKSIGSFVGQEPPAGSIEVPTDAPADGATWNGTAWVVPSAAMTAMIYEAVKMHRDMCSQTIVSVESATSGTLTVMNDDRTRSALVQKLLATLNADDPDTTIPFKLKNLGFKVLPIADLQLLLQACNARQQKCFDAEQQVRLSHGIAPYASVAAAIAAFDGFVNT